eukprot:205626_1
MGNSIVVNDSDSPYISLAKIIETGKTDDCQQFDFSPFKLKKYQCQKLLKYKTHNAEKSQSVVGNCDSLTRISSALKYYDLGSDKKDTNFHYYLIQFCHEIYEQFLDDYIHIIRVHGEDLMEISAELRGNYGHKQCDVTQCLKINRHYARHRIPDINDNAEYDFYAACFDRLHHFIFHLFDMGLRSDQRLQMYVKDDDLIINYVYIDKHFKQRRNFINASKTRCGLNVERYNDKNNKFNIHTLHLENKHALNSGVIDDSVVEAEENKQLMQAKPITSIRVNGGETFLDGTFEYIEQNDTGVTSDQLLLLEKNIIDNEYDSDAVKYDADGWDETKSSSNLYNQTGIASFIDYILKCIAIVERSKSSFSTGFVFFYWPYFKTQTQQQRGDWLDGFCMADLYVLPHYGSFKEEILLSGYVSVVQWTKKIVNKATRFMRTKKVKFIKALPGAANNHHGYKFGDAILPAHLYSIILYCDWSDLCTDFSKTFRRDNPFEPITSIKKRHSEYYHFGKSLVEAVNNFGVRWSREYGPFFCGMSFVMNIPSFAIYLKGPCSTSKNVEISINFATRDGMIVQLNNDQWYQGANQSFFDCSWISNYLEENERLFVSGSFRLRIESITIIETADNYELFFHAFYLFDSMISSVPVDNMSIKHGDQDILHNITQTRLKKQPNSFTQYINDVFDLFLHAKTQIKIHMEYLDKYFEELTDLVIHKVAITRWQRVKKENDLVNVFKADILSIFPNVHDVIIQTTDNGSYNVYKFDLLSFLSSIKSSTMRVKYTIKAERDIYDRSWLNNILIADPEISKKFKSENWMINATAVRNKYGKYTDCLSIEKHRKTPVIANELKDDSDDDVVNELLFDGDTYNIKTKGGHEF